MSEYDRAAWIKLEEWRTKRLSPRERNLLPKGAREKIAKAGERVGEGFEKIPGASQFIELFNKALEGVTGLISRTADASMRRQAVIDAYRRSGHQVTDLADVRKLELRDVDQVSPRLGLRYTAFSSAEGAVTGLAVSGGEILAGGGAIFGAGVGAAPGAGTVVGALAVDAAAVLGAMSRATAHIAAYYGYDTDLPEEQVFAVGILSFSLAGQSGKSAAYIELNKVVQELVRKASWETLNKNGVTKVVRAIYERLGLRLTKQKLGGAVPVIGIAVGAGLNAHMLERLTTDADRLYRERFLREKYGIPATTDSGAAQTAPGHGGAGIDVIRISELIDGELDIDAGLDPGRP
ncbi:EcsC family protein [Parafrankia sp. EUN1f]|uniref:EcsC family protein n=1 Tax=Parafrankia sp. EUN1f TaxID=102897 RepID=UPI0006804E76|nr:EcsC family protein [Parafrankia sp. EUN1f]